MPLRNSSRGVSEGAARDDDGIGSDLDRARIGVEEPHATRLRPLASTMISTAMLSGRTSHRPDCKARRKRRDGIALGFDRTAVEGAEPAVVARRPAVVRDAVRPSVGAVRVSTRAARRGGHRQRREEHVGARRHRVRAAAPRREGVARVITRHADDPFGVHGERLELVVVERPVGDVGTVDRAVFRGETGNRPRADGAASRRRGSRHPRASTACCCTRPRGAGRRRPRRASVGAQARAVDPDRGSAGGRT